MRHSLLLTPLLLLACKGPSDTQDTQDTGDTGEIYTPDCGEDVWDWDLEDCVPARCGEGRFGAIETVGKTVYVSALAEEGVVAPRGSEVVAVGLRDGRWAMGDRSGHFYASTSTPGWVLTATQSVLPLDCHSRPRTDRQTASSPSRLSPRAEY